MTRDDVAHTSPRMIARLDPPHGTCANGERQVGRNDVTHLAKDHCASGSTAWCTCASGGRSVAMVSVAMMWRGRVARLAHCIVTGGRARRLLRLRPSSPRSRASSASSSSSECVSAAHVPSRRRAPAEASRRLRRAPAEASRRTAVAPRGCGAPKPISAFEGPPLSHARALSPGPRARAAERR